MKSGKYIVFGILIGIAILYLVLRTLEDPNMLENQNRYQINNDLSMIEKAVVDFNNMYHRLPNSLTELVDKHYLKREPIDPWGKIYGYHATEKAYTVFTFGKDNKQGGSGVNSDVNKVIVVQE